MPTAFKTPCRIPGCVNLGTTGYCDDHAKIKEQMFQRSRESSYSRGYDSRWRTARLMHLKRQPLCVHCLDRGEHNTGTDVDHIVPHRGDMRVFWDTSNWQTLCKTCHAVKTATEDGRWTLTPERAQHLEQRTNLGR